MDYNSWMFLMAKNPSVLLFGLAPDLNIAFFCLFLSILEDDRISY